METIERGGLIMNAPANDNYNAFIEMIPYYFLGLMIPLAIVAAIWVYRDALFSKEEKKKKS